MKKKNNKLIVLITTLTIFLVALMIFILNYSKDDTSYSLAEKKWLSDNENNVIDVSVYNDIPIFGESGSGIIFDYLDNFTSTYGINFNKVSYTVANKPSDLKDLAFKVIDTTKTISESDILLYEDKYVIVSKESIVFNQVNDIKDVKLGLFEDDLTLANYYLTGSDNLTYRAYEDIDALFEGLNNEEVTHLLLPYNQYLDKIIENELNIVYHLNDISKKYVISVNDNNKLLSILNKYTIKYKNENYNEVLKNNFINVVFDSLDISEEDKMNYNADSYTFGYVSNIPYEVNDDNSFGGIISNYLTDFEELFDVDFKIVEYDTIANLKQALSDGDIDLVFANYSTNGLKIDKVSTLSPTQEKYVILSKNTNCLNSIRSLKDQEVMVVNNTFLLDYLSANGIVPKEYDNIENLLRNLDYNSIIILDYETYNYYKDHKLSSFNVIYDGVINNDYSFIIRDVNKNSTFIKLFSFYVSTVNYNDIKYNYQINESYLTTNFSNILKYLLIILTLFIIGFIIAMLIKKKTKNKVIKKDEKLKFIDLLTSLKNRNYLNFNIAKWEENIIYPQSFVVIDLNNIKVINDSHGHEEGDNVIKKAASILIINQLENTDIMRTDGNEFLVYMVGYSEKDVIAYTRKIYKELKSLPYGFGASIGYSMITDDIKTIDDAINEATLEMRKAKENNKQYGA